jgi:hypothetical protein
MTVLFSAEGNRIAQVGGKAAPGKREIEAKGSSSCPAGSFPKRPKEA